MLEAAYTRSISDRSALPSYSNVGLGYNFEKRLLELCEIAGDCLFPNSRMQTMKWQYPITLWPIKCWKHSRR